MYLIYDIWKDYILPKEQNIAFFFNIYLEEFMSSSSFKCRPTLMRNKKKIRKKTMSISILAGMSFSLT